MKTRRELENLLLANTQGGVFSDKFAEAIAAVLANQRRFAMSPVCKVSLPSIAGPSLGEATSLAEPSRIGSSQDGSDEGGAT